MSDRCWLFHRWATLRALAGVFSLRNTGRLRAHGYSQARYYATGPGCPGSGAFPVAAAKAEREERSTNIGSP